MTFNSSSCCFCTTFVPPSIKLSQGKKTSLQVSNSWKKTGFFTVPKWSKRMREDKSVLYYSIRSSVPHNQPEPEPPNRPDRTEPSRKPPAPIPTVYMGDTQMDIYSRLAKDRILLLGRAVDDEVGFCYLGCFNSLMCELVYR